MCSAAVSFQRQGVQMQRGTLVSGGIWVYGVLRIAYCVFIKQYAIRNILRLSIFLVSVFLLSGCASVQPVVKVGLVGPFEGANRAVGYDVIYSARLAVREINEAGGIGGYRVALVALDDSGDPQLAQEGHRLAADSRDESVVF